MTYAEETQKLLVKVCNEIQQFLEITCSDNPQEVEQRGHDLSVYLARTGKMLADAKLLNMKQRGEASAKVLEMLGDGVKMSDQTQKDFITPYCSETQYIVDWVERLNKTITHQLEWCRTVLSKAKEEMRYTSFQK